MLTVLILLLTVIILATITVAMVARKTDREVRVWWIIVINGVVIALTVAVVGVGWYGFLAYRHDTCVTRSQGRNDSRAVSLTLYDTIDQATGTTRFTTDALKPGELSLRQSLDAKTPELDPTACPKHP